MLPPAYPQVRVRTKLAIAPYVLLLVVILGVLEDQGVIELGAAPPATTQPPVGAAPSRAARAEIPARYLALYQQAAGTCPHLSWALLAAIGKAESDHGRWRLPGVRSGANPAGAMGPMQFLPGTWARYGRGGNVHDPADAIPAAARYLCDNAGPRGTWGPALRAAAYNAGPAAVADAGGIPPIRETRRYVARVMSAYRRYGGR